MANQPQFSLEYFLLFVPVHLMYLSSEQAQITRNIPMKIVVE